jgi:hypothetical protein
MARFNKTDRRLWADKNFLALSERGKLLWFYFLTGPEVTNLPGVLVVGRLQLAETFGWSAKEVDARFGEISGRGMAVADWNARLVFLPKAAKYNPPANPNVITGWAARWDNVPECPLKFTVYETLKQVVEPLAEPLRQQFAKCFGDGSANQKQEQEQEQEQKTPTGTAAVPAAAKLGGKFRAAFVAAWEAKYGRPYAFAGAKDGAAAKALAETLAEAEWGAVIGRYFADGADFFTGHPLAKLRSQVHRFLVGRPDAPAVDPVTGMFTSSRKVTAAEARALLGTEDACAP